MYSHKKFWLAIVVLAVVAIALVVATARLSHELSETQNTLWLVKQELEATQAQLVDAEAELAAVKVELGAARELVESLEAELFNLQVNYERLTTGYGYVLRDPSYREMQDFLARDMTSERTYDRDTYDCVDFAADVKANAAREGIRCAYVVIEYPGETGHAVVAFDTTDKGIVYIEPQFDWEVELKIGQRYYQCVKAPPGHYVVRPSYDDTIMRITVMW